MSLRPRRCPPLPIATALSVLLLCPLALAGDEPTAAQKMDRAGQQISEALAGLSALKLDKPAQDKHLEKARGLLARARAELLQAQGQSTTP